MITQMTKRIHTHTKTKQEKQFLDFIKRVDRKYNSSIKQIFLSNLGNISIHRLKKYEKQYKNTIHESIWYFYQPDLRRMKPNRIVDVKDR